MSSLESSTPSASETQLCRRHSAEHEAEIRAMIRSWAGIPPSPPSCQAIMYSSWTRFAAGDVDNKTDRDMRTSVLWAPRATVADFNPPILERVGLSTEDVCSSGGKPAALKARCRNKTPMKLSRRRPSSTASWETDDSSDSSSTGPQAIRFDREPIKSPGTVSLISESLKLNAAKQEAQPIKAQSLLAAWLDAEVVSSSMLPSGFSLDSDEDSFMETTRHYGNDGDGGAIFNHDNEP